MLGLPWKLLDLSHRLFSPSPRHLRSPPFSSGHFTAEKWYQKLHLATVSIVASQVDAGRERNGREKVRQLRSCFPIPAMTVAEIGAFSFVSMRKEQIWFYFLKSMKGEGESNKKSSWVFWWVFMFSGDQAIVGEVNGIYLHSLVDLYVLVYFVFIFG